MKPTFAELLKDATEDDLRFVRATLLKKTEGGYNRIANTEAEVARRHVALIEAEMNTRKIPIIPVDGSRCPKCGGHGQDVNSRLSQGNTKLEVDYVCQECGNEWTA